MNTRYAAIFASLSFALLANGQVWAREDAALPPASSEMTQEEYAAYRARIREQLKAAQQAENKDEADQDKAETKTRRKPNKGYGQGYRARQERAGGGMGRAGGRGR
jgi:hypothetical protein